MRSDAFAVDEVRDMGDEELITRLRELVCADQALHARLLVHLGEVEARGLYRDHAHSSMFTYCIEELRMSEAQAYLRIQAARLGRQFPRVLEMVARGSLNLTGIKLLGPHLTADNHVRLLERASGKRKREIELLVAEIAPKPDVASRTRKLPEARTSRRAAREVVVTPASMQRAPGSVETTAASAGQLTAAPSVDASVSPAAAREVVVTPASMQRAPFETTPASAAVPSAAPRVEANEVAFALEAPRPHGSAKPLRPGRYKVEFTAGQELHDKLAQLQDLLRHQVPDGELAVIVERAVDLLLEETMKKRFAQTRAPKKGRSSKARRGNSRYVPRAVVREVYQRDGGQCTFVSADGKRCRARGFLEVHHHDRPFAKGGEATVENLRLACRAHNGLFADRDYGRGFMRSKRTHTQESGEPLGPGTSASSLIGSALHAVDSDCSTPR